MKIITWNIAGLPKYVNLYGDPELRVEPIIKKLASYKADIIFLQEVFTQSLIDQIKNAFNKIYHIRFNTTRHKLSLVGSGLIVLLLRSKFQINSNKFTSFNLASGEDRLANKGYQILRVGYLPKKINLKLINTHLNNPTPLLSQSKSSKLVTRQQMNIIKNNFNNSRLPCILGGDLNLKNISLNCNGVKNKIDYICVNGLKLKKDSKKVVNSKLSDHSMLIYNFTF
jgi:exonuclease III